MTLGTRTIFLAAILALALVAPAVAQNNATAAPAANAPAAAAPTTPVTTAPLPPAATPSSTAASGTFVNHPHPETWPIPDAAKPGADGKMDAEAATKAYLAYISGDARKKSDAYFEGSYWLILWDAVVSLAVAAALLWFRWSAKMRDVAARMTKSRFLQVPIYVFQYFIVAAVLTFPWTVYENFIREHKYGLSNQDFMGWFTDWIKLFGVALGVFVVLLTIIYVFIRATKDNWWKWGVLVSFIFAVFTGMLYPVYVAPLINDYKPLEEGTIKEQMLAMVRANGVPATNIYEFNASKQTKRMSANVSGLMNTTRVSVNDNLMNRASPAEIRGVLGHELGHYVLGHNYTGLSWALIEFFIAFWFANWGFKKLVARYGKSWGVTGIDDPAGLPVIFAMLTFIGFIGTPIENTSSRFIEGQADIFGMNAAREPDGFAQAALHLSEYRKLEPAYWEEVVFYDHPSGRTRISMAMHWKSEHLNDADMIEKAKTPLQ